MVGVKRILTDDVVGNASDDVQHLLPTDPFAAAVDTGVRLHFHDTPWIAPC